MLLGRYAHPKITRPYVHVVLWVCLAPPNPCLLCVCVRAHSYLESLLLILYRIETLLSRHDVEAGEVETSWLIRELLEPQQSGELVVVKSSPGKRWRGKS